MVLAGISQLLNMRYAYSPLTQASTINPKATN
jgi:hypothetical protein